MEQLIKTQHLHTCIKWIGSKSLQTKTIIPKILESLQHKKIYIEPFVGGGSVIIEILKQCYLNDITNVSFQCFDINEIIIRMFNEIKNKPLELIEKLKPFLGKSTKEDYYRIRNEYNANPNVEQFMYLNKNCFRGLYRVNKKGMFNTSFSHARNPPVFVAENIIEF